jgi:hypothetical protein
MCGRAGRDDPENGQLYSEAIAPESIWMAGGQGSLSAEALDPSKGRWRRVAGASECLLVAVQSRASSARSTDALAPASLLAPTRATQGVPCECDDFAVQTSDCRRAHQ